jgi:hypothetical protein
MRPSSALEQRVADLEIALYRTRVVASLVVVVGLVGLASGFTNPGPQVVDEVRTRRLVVLDDSGRTRAVIGQDAANVQRLARAAGLLLYDDKGLERGGFSTLGDGSVVIGLDAPVGVGSAMHDRIGLKVFPNGAAYVMLIDNQTGAVARLISEVGPDGARGVQVFKWAGSHPYVRTISYDGDVRDSTGR